MQKTNFGQLVDKEINLILKASGFKRKGTTWTKKVESGFLVVNRRANPKRFEDLNTAYPKFRFSIWLGVYYEFVGPQKGQHSLWTPREEECHVRASLYKTIQQFEEPSEITWAVRSDSRNLDEVMDDVKKTVKAVAIAFLEEYSNPLNAFNMMRVRKFPREILGWGGADSPLFHYTFGYICLHLGERLLAYRSFQEVMKERESSSYAILIKDGCYSSLLSTLVNDDFQRLSSELNISDQSEKN